MTENEDSSSNSDTTTNSVDDVGQEKEIINEHKSNHINEEKEEEERQEEERLYQHYNTYKIEDIMSEMKKDTRNNSLQEACLRIINEHAQDPKHQKDAIAPGVFEVIRTAMEAHEESESVQARGVAALSNLTHNIIIHRDEDAQHASSQNTNGSSRSPQDATEDPESQIMREVLACIDIVINTLYKYPCNEEIQVNGCAFFANITDKHAPKTPGAELENESITTCVIGAMGCLPLNMALQTACCTALANMTSRSGGSSAIVSSIRDLCGIEVIVTAIMNHCSAAANNSAAAAATTTLVKEGLRAVGAIFEHSRDDAAKEVHTRIVALGGVQLIVGYIEAPETTKCALYALAQVVWGGNIVLDTSVLRLVVEVLRNDTTSKGALRWGLVLLAEAVAADPAAKGVLHELNGLDTALRTFELHANNAKIAAACCKFICSYIRGDNGIGGSVERATNLVEGALKAFTKSMDVQSCGVDALGSILAITADFSGSDALEMEARVLAAVMGAMRAYPSCSAVQASGCRALSKSSPERTPEPAATKCVLRAMKHHKKERAVQLSACSFFFNHLLVLESSSGEEALKALKDVAGLIIELLRTVGDDPEVSSAYCHAIACIARDTKGATMIRECAGVTALNYVLSRAVTATKATTPPGRNENTAQWACCALGAIFSHAKTAAQTMATNDRTTQSEDGESMLPVLKSIVKAMAIYPENEEVQRWGCSVLCSSGTRQERIALVGDRGIRALGAVANAMAAHPASMSVQCNGCCALYALCKSTGSRGQEQAREHRALQLVIAAMKQFPENTRVQQLCCMTLGTMAARNGENQTVAGSIEGGVEALIATMNRHPSSTEVQMASCVALRQLCVGNVDNAVITGIKGGIAALVMAANHNINSAPFIREVLRTLRGIVDVNHFNGTTFCENGGVDMVIAATKLYGGDTSVLSDSCHILAYSAFEGPAQTQNVYNSSDNTSSSNESGVSSDEIYKNETTCNDYGHGILDDDDDDDFSGESEIDDDDDEDSDDDYDQESPKITRPRRKRQLKRKARRSSRQGMLMGDDGGSVQALINAMRAQPEIEGLQASCCLALAKAALREGDAKTIVIVGGTVAIIDAMQRFCGSSAEIQGNGCLALARLARHGTNEQNAVLGSGGVDAVIGAMSAHIACIEVQKWGCTALGTVSLRNKGGRAIVGAAGGVQAVTRALQQHQGNEAVACLGCYALSCIVEDSAKNKEIAGTCGAIGGCITTLKRFQEARRAQHWAAHAVAKIVAGTPTNARLLSTLGGVDALVGTMRLHAAESRRILSACCDALGNAALGCAAVAKAAKARGALELIIEGMGRFGTNAVVLESALLALGNMSYNNPEVAMALGGSGGIEAVLDSILEFRKNQRVQETGLYALSNIASGAVNKKHIGAAGGIEATVLSMNTFPAVIPVQESGLLLLLHVCTGEGENVQRAYEAGAVKTVLGILARCSGNTKIENISCILLSELSHCNVEVQNAICAGNGIRMIFSVMERNNIFQASDRDGGGDDTNRSGSGAPLQKRVKILESCLYALGNIAQRNISNQMAIGKQGVALICAVMCGSLGYVELQQKGALVLGSLTSNGLTEIQNMISEAGGIRALLGAMREYPENVELQCNCCMALSNVVYHNPANQSAIGNGIEAVVNALQRFPENEALQEHGCFALGSILEGNEANTASFCREREYFKTIVDAMRTHQYSQRILVRCCYTLTTCGATAAARVAAASSSASKDVARYTQLVEAAVQRTVDCINSYSDNEDIQACGTQALACILRAGKNDLRTTFVRASGVEVILSVMEYNANDPEILYWCSTVLGCATDSVIESRQRIETCDGVRVILETMFAYPQSAEIQLVCCKLLTNIAIGSSTDIAGLGSGYSSVKGNIQRTSQHDLSSSNSSSSSSSLSSPSSSSRLEELSTAILEDGHGIEPSLRQEDAQRIQESIRGWKEETVPVRVARCTTIGGGGGVDAVLGAMRSNPTDKEVQRYGCRTLSALAADNRRMRKCIGERGGVEVVLGVLSRFQDQRSVVQSALEVLASITTDSMANVLLVQDAHGLCLPLDIARRYESVEAIQFLSCLVVGNLAVDKTNQAALGNSGAVGVAIGALSSFQKVANVQGVGCFALARLADESLINQQLVTAGGGVRCALAALRDFPQDKRIQKWALCMLYNATHDAKARANAVAKKGVELALAALKCYRTEIGVQKWALYVVGRLAAGNNACRERIGEALGIDSILESMRAHPKCGKVQCAGCYALGSVVLTRENQERVRRLGGIGVVVQAMTAFPTDVSLQHHGCLAIGRAVFASPEAARAKAITGPAKPSAAVGAFDAIAACMNNHSSVPEIQAGGCFAFFSALSSSVAGPADLQALDTLFPWDFTQNSKRRRPRRSLVLTDVRATPALQRAFVSRGGVAAVIRALKALPESAATQEFGCAALGCYALGNAAIHDSSVSASCIEIAMAALNRARDTEDRTVQASAVFALCSVVDNSPRDSLALGERDDVGTFSQVLDSVCKGDGGRGDDEGEDAGDWRRNALEPSITEFCCRILANISVCNGAESQALVGSDNNIRLLVRVISTYFHAMSARNTNKMSLLNNALIALGCTIFNNKRNQDATASALREAGCTDIVLRVMSTACVVRSFRMIGNCCHVLTGLCVNNPSCKQDVTQCGGIESVLRAMHLAKERRSQLTPKAQALQAPPATLSSTETAAASTSRNPSVADYDDAQQRIKRSRSFDVINVGAEEGTEDRSDNEIGVLQMAQEWGVKFLGIMSDRSKENTERICENGGVELTSGVMHAYSDSEEAQANGCFTLANLGACGSEGLKTFMLEAGVLEGIIAALRTHAKSKKVQRYGCFALSNIAQSSARCKRRLCNIGGIEAVAGAMRAYADDEDIQRCCCYALCNIVSTSSPASQERMLSCGAVELVLSCMERFPENADIQSVCCKCLGSIALKNEKTQRAIGTCETALRTVLSCMERFPEDGMLQENGCYALLAVMRRSSGGVLQTVPVESAPRAAAERLREGHAAPLFTVSRAVLVDAARVVTAALQRYQQGHSMLVNLGLGVFCTLFKADVGLADARIVFECVGAGNGEDELVAKAALLTLSQFCMSTVAAITEEPNPAKARAAADVRAKCVETAITSMQKHPKHVSVQSCGCFVLAMCETWAYLQEEEEEEKGEDGSRESNSCTTQIRDTGGIKVIVDALKNHTNTRAVLVNGAMALAGIAYRDKAGQVACAAAVADGEKTSAIEAVLESMGLLPTDEELQRAACVMLKNVTKPLNGGEALINESMCNRISRAAEGALLAHKKSLPLQILGVAVLRNIARTGPRGVRVCQLAHGNDLALALMEHFPDSPDAQAAACKALAPMGMKQQEAEKVLCVLAKFACCERVQAHGCNALLEYTSAAGGSRTSEWAQASAAAAMDAMEMFSASLRVQLAGCHVLTVVKRRNDKRAVALADAVLRRFPDERAAVEGGLAVIANSAVSKEDAGIVGHEVVRGIYAVMERHAEAESVLELCYTVLTGATAKNATNAATFEAVGGIPALVRTLETFTASGTATSLLSWAVNLLGNIAGKCQDSIQESGAIELLVAAMRGHPMHDLIQGNACYALAGIADGHPANKRRIAAAGGAEAIVAALRGEYSESSGLYIRRWGCAALAALSQGGGPKDAALIGAAGSIEAVMTAMAQSPGDRQTQLCGVRTLENAAIPECPENTARMMADNTGIDLACAAMAAFRSDTQVQIHCLNVLKCLVPAAPLSHEALVLEHVGAALTAHIRNTSVVFCGCCALEELSLRAEPWPERMAGCANILVRVLDKYVASNGIQRKCLETLVRIGKATPVSVDPEIVINSMERHPNSAPILGSGFALLERTQAGVSSTALVRAVNILLHMTGDFTGEVVETLLCGCRVTVASLAQSGRESVGADLARCAAKLFSSVLLVLCRNRTSGSSPVDAAKSIYAALCDLASQHHSIVIAEKATGAIALSMKDIDDGAELKVAGCTALRDIAAHKSVEDLCIAEELRIVVETIKTHHASTEVQVSGCNALKAIVEGSPAARQLVPEDASAVLIARTGEGQDPAVVAAAFAVLAAITRDSQGAQSRALACGCMEAVAAAIANERVLDSAALVACLGFLTALSSENADAQAAARSQGIVALLKSVAAKRSSNTGVLEACMHAYLSVSGRSGPELRELAESEGEIGFLVGALKRWTQQGSFSTVKAGLDVLGAVYEAGYGELLMAKGGDGIPGLVVSLLLTTSDAAACAHCLLFVARMAQRCPKSADSFLRVGGLGAIVDTLAAHSDKAGTSADSLEELRARSAAAMGSLALFGQERAMEICASGGLEFLKSLMRGNPKSLAVQEQCALAISYVLSNDVVHKRYCMEANAIAQLAGAAKLHRTSLCIEASLYALRRLVLEQNKKWEAGKAAPQYVFYLDADMILCKRCWKKYHSTHPDESFKVFFLPWICDHC